MNNFIIEIVRILRSLWIQIEQIAPYWAIGIVAGSIINVYLSEKIVNKISAFKDKKFSFTALCLFAVLGIASPLCMFGTVPLIASLGKKEVPQYLLAAFMICSILLNPNLLIMSFALGVNVALLRLCLSLFAGLLAGVIIYVFFKNRPLFKLDAFVTNQDKKNRVLWRDLLKALRITTPYFFTGILLTSLYDLYFPKHLMDTVFAGNQAMGSLFAMSLSIPLHACGGGAIPLLLAWMQEGMSIGNALTFMLAGSAMKFTNLGAVKIILGTKNFLLYVLYCLGLSFVLGTIVNGFFRIVA